MIRALVLEFFDLLCLHTFYFRVICVHFLRMMCRCFCCCFYHRPCRLLLHMKFMHARALLAWCSCACLQFQCQHNFQITCTSKISFTHAIFLILLDRPGTDSAGFNAYSIGCLPTTKYRRRCLVISCSRCYLLMCYTSTPIGGSRLTRQPTRCKRLT